MAAGDEHAALIADMRTWAASGEGVIYTLRSKHNGSIAIFVDDVDAHPTDEGLLAFIRQRCNEPSDRELK